MSGVLHGMVMASRQLDTNTGFLLKANGANNSTSFTDISKNNFAVTANGDAKTSTSTRKFSTSGSVSFDGTGDYLTFPGTNLQLGSGNNFTIEMWYYGNVSTFYGNIIGSTANFETTNSLRITTGPGGNQIVVATGASNVLITASSTFSNSTWIHFALVRSGTALTMYQDGVSVGTAVNSQTFVADTYYIGSAILGNGAPYPINAFLQDFRISTSARYTNNFTPPTIEFAA